ncbi:beta-lactamase family protein [Legionella sp. 27fs60]|nr:beta-lactamase family protein [Legionella bononiensis]
MNLMRCILSVLFIISLLLIKIDAYSMIDKKWIDTKINNFVNDHPVKAITYGLWINGKPISIHALGKSMTAVPATTAMHFRIGGITETMLTTLLMQMVEQKIVSLDDKVSNWFPNLPNANRVTLKMLANCTSGYPDYVYNKKFIEVNTNHPFKLWTDNEIIEYAMMDSPLFQPGTNQKYSHTDYVLLADILSRASHKSLKLLYKSGILDKLDLTNSQYIRTANIPYPVLHAFTQDRGVYEDSTFWNPSWTSFAAMISTISDLGVWANAWMNGSLLSENSTKILRSADTVGKGTNTNDAYFAMGFEVVNHWLLQNPSFGGYSGVFAVLPEKKLVFIAFNTVKKNQKDSANLSMDLWRYLAPDLAPEYPIPTSGHH